MSAPYITFTAAQNSSSLLTTLSFGNVDAGTTTSPLSVWVWNNRVDGLGNGVSTVSDTNSTTFTTRTYTGQDSTSNGGSDTAANGQQVVDTTIVQVRCVTLGESGSTWYSVGGSTNAHTIGSASGGSGIIKGSIGGDYAVIAVRLNVPSNVTAGPTQWLGRVSYLYS
jgi:hypothetical protein